MKKITLTIVLCLTMLSTHLLAQTHNWTGNGGDSNWFNPANWNLNSVPNANSNTLISATASNVEITTGTAESSFVTVHNSATLTLDADLIVTGSITIDTNASMIWRSGTISGGCTIENTSLLLMEGPSTKTLDAVTVNNNGDFNINNSNQIILANGVVINNAFQKVINVTSVGGFISQGTNATLNNDGVLRKSPDGVNPFGNFYLILDINNTGQIDIFEDETFLCLGANITLNNTGVISGIGTFDITANFLNTGIVLPGGAENVGTLHIINNFTLSPPGTIVIDIGIDPLSNDVIEVTGSPVLNGNITLFLDGDLNLGDEFTILTATNNILNCSFPEYVYADTFNGTVFEFEVSCLQNSVVLNVTNILDIDDFNSGEINFYATPNPANDITEFVIPSEVFQHYPNVNIAVFNYLGQQIETVPMTSENKNLDISGYATGLYFAHLRGGNDVLSITKIAVE